MKLSEYFEKYAYHFGNIFQRKKKIVEVYFFDFCVISLTWEKWFQILAMQHCLTKTNSTDEKKILSVCIGWIKIELLN